MSKTVVVTGANRGIGLALVEHYRRRGDRVVAVCRQTSQELKACGVESVEGVDLGNPDAGEKLRDALQGTIIDVLINNAGILRVERLGQIDWESGRGVFVVTPSVSVHAWRAEPKRVDKDHWPSDRPPQI